MPSLRSATSATAFAITSASGVRRTCATEGAVRPQPASDLVWVGTVLAWVLAVPLASVLLLSAVLDIRGRLP